MNPNTVYEESVQECSKTIRELREKLEFSKKENILLEGKLREYMGDEGLSDFLEKNLG